MIGQRVCIVVSSALLLFTWGCTSMKTLSRNEFSDLNENTTVQVTMMDGSQHIVKESRIQNSTLVGLMDGERIAEIDLSDIETIKIKKLNYLKTSVAGAVGIAGVMVLISTLRTSESIPVVVADPPASGGTSTYPPPCTGGG